jgi:subtilisin-like proprotein convertase family protein
LTTGTNIGYGGAASPAAPGNSPRGFIGSITFVSAAPCSGTPAPGNTISSVPTVCPGTNFSLSLQNNTPGSGVTYQWQSATALAGPYANITGATNSNYSTTLTAPTYYQCIVTCSGNSGTSTPVQVLLTPPSGCYCTPPTTNCNLDDEILNVTFAGINNNSLCGTNGYTNYTSSVAAASVVAGGTYPMSVSVGPGGTEYVGVWIDANQNGNFETTEFTALGSGNGVTISNNVTVPATASIGTTRMRVRVRYNTALTGGNACLGYAFGETEDYAITINPCIPVALTTQPANSTVQCGANASFTVAASGSGPAFKWQERTSATALWVDLTNTAPYSGVTTNTLTITGATVNMNGYQYRALYSGYCRAIDYSSIATLTVNPLVATVNPPSAVLCNGAIQQLTITNITAPQPFSTTVSSGPIAVAIPDNNVAGANHTLNVSTIPAASAITGINVKFTIPHTYSGDLVIALKAPNGAVLNLDYYITGTFPGGNGFLNTVISSATGLPALSSGSGTFTGTYRPDAQVAATANGPSGPTGFAATVNNFAGLYTTGGSANGAWTLAIYDGGAIDLGTLTSWEISFNYVAGIPATGVWEPTTPNTIYTDAAATIPYVPGTPANSVYVLPTTTTTYTVVVTTPTCVSGVTNIPVTVSNPVGTVTSPVNKAICVNGNTSFTVSAATGNTITYNWQVSTDGGGTWTNISNNSIYSGATTNTLTLTGVPASYNNNKYRSVLTVSACSSTVNSGAATLTVNPLPVVVINAGPTTQLHPGITSTMTAAVSPNAAATYQWYRNGVAITGANAANYTVDVDGLGEYSVSVSDVNGCDGASLTKISITADPSEIMFIYPSPNTGQFQVRYQSLDGNLLPRIITIYDSKGSRVYSKTYTTNAPYGRMDVDLGNISRGIYRVELSDHNGTRVKTGSVVVF